MGHLNLPRRIHEPQNKFPKSGDDWIKPHRDIINKSRFRDRLFKDLNISVSIHRPTSSPNNS